jgi:hypothetical protein
MNQQIVDKVKSRIPHHEDENGYLSGNQLVEIIHRTLQEHNIDPASDLGMKTLFEVAAVILQEAVEVDDPSNDKAMQKRFGI